MRDNELNQKSDLIWSKLNSIESENRAKEEELGIIKNILIDISNDSIEVGRKQIINHFQTEVNNLKSK